MSYISNYTGTEIDSSVALTKQIIDIIYPVGSIYMSVNNVSPATFLGGTWTQIQDTFLMAAGSNYTAGSSGGSANHTHSTNDLVLTVAQTPAHTHTRGTMNITGGFAPWTEGAGNDITGEQGAFYSVASTQYGWGTTDGRDADNEYMYFDASRSWTGETSSVGSGEAHNHGNTSSSSNLPPYLVVYIWKRTS